MENDEYVDYQEIPTEESKEENKVVKLAKENEDFARNYLKLHTPLTASKLPGRNDICPYCDSGKKFKNCDCFKTHKVEYKNQYYI